MAWLRRRKQSDEAAGTSGTPADTHEQPPKTAPPPAATTDARLLDGALDTLAAVVRALGRTAFDLDTRGRDEIADDCESWAGHVLNAGPLPGGESAPSPGRRHWSGLRDFVTDHRQAERKFVEGRAKALKDVIHGVVQGLRGLVGDDQQLTSQLEQGFSTLETAVTSGDLNQLGEALPGVLQNMRGALAEHQVRRQKEMSAMHARLQALSEDLAASQARAVQDPLTGLANRGGFDDRIASLLPMSQVSERPLTLFMVDLDHFKRINDTYGHPGGDEVLRQAGKALIRAFPRRDDFVARYGGEEFAILASDADPVSAERMAIRLLNAIRRMDVPFEGQLIPVTCSVGYATLKHDETVEAFMKRADQALYRAKKAGRDRSISAELD
ncbi:MAG: diguanylate cyclase [Bradymonadia bacterium]